MTGRAFFVAIRTASETNRDPVPPGEPPNGWDPEIAVRWPGNRSHFPDGNDGAAEGSPLSRLKRAGFATTLPPGPFRTPEMWRRSVAGRRW